MENGMDELVEDMYQTSYENIEADREDYFVDGLLYCGKCHTAKQTRVRFMGREITPMCLCECEAERLEKEKAEREEDERFNRIMAMRSAGFSDKQMRDWTFDNDDQSNMELTTIAKNYVDNFRQMKAENHGLLLHGTVGTGKTYIAACIANALIDKDYPCLVTNFNRIVNEIQSSFEHRQENIDRLNDYDLLVIDDLAAERNSEYMNEMIFTIIDERYRSRLPLIVTTNLTMQEMESRVNVTRARIFSRLFEMCVPVEVKGKERRAVKFVDNYAEVMKQLKVPRED